MFYPIKYGVLGVPRAGIGWAIIYTLSCAINSLLEDNKLIVSL
jgi:hypothetical protein